MNSILILIMECSQESLGSQRDKWMSDLITSIGHLQQSLKDVHASEEITRRAVVDFSTVEFMTKLNIREVIQEEHFYKLSVFLGKFLAETKASFDLYISSIYASSQPAYEQKHLWQLMEHACYTAAYLAALCVDVAEEMELYPPIVPQAGQLLDPPVEPLPEGEEAPEQSPVQNTKISPSDFRSLGKAFQDYTEDMKYTIRDSIQKSAIKPPSFIKKWYSMTKTFFITAYKSAELAPTALILPLFLTQYIFHYWAISTMLPGSESQSISSLMLYCDAQDNVIVAFLIKYTAISILRTCVIALIGGRLDALEEGINYKSVQFARSMLFYAVFFNFFQELGKNRTWASLMIDTTAYEALSYLDELCLNLYAQMANVRFYYLD